MSEVAIAGNFLPSYCFLNVFNFFAAYVGLVKSNHDQDAFEIKNMPPSTRMVPAIF